MSLALDLCNLLIKSIMTILVFFAAPAPAGVVSSNLYPQLLLSSVMYVDLLHIISYSAVIRLSLSPAWPK